MRKEPMKTISSKSAQYEALFNELKAISHKALAECPAPTPIIVGSPSTPLGNDVDPNQKTWFVEGGVCGFATVVLESGRSGFAQWLVQERPMGNKLGSKWWSFGRAKGVGLYTFERYGFADAGQSFERKRFIANRMAQHLRSKGFECWVDARID
jgi:hypothetical protein